MQPDYYPKNGEPATALVDYQELSVLEGYAWVDGLDASLTADLDLSLGSGTVLVDGATDNRVSQTVPLPDADGADPRWVVVYSSTNGLDAVAGEPDRPRNYPNDPLLQLRYAGKTRMESPIPALPDMSSVYGSTTTPVPLWAVWLPAGASVKSDLAAGKKHLYDRRLQRDPAIEQAGSLDPDGNYNVHKMTSDVSQTEELLVSKTISNDVEVPDGDVLMVPEGVDIDGSVTLGGRMTLLSTDTQQPQPEPDAVSEKSNVKRSFGNATYSGDGATTSFRMPHGLPTTPDTVIVNAQSADASANRVVTWDETEITVTYAIPPEKGNENLKYHWSAEVGGQS